MPCPKRAAVRPLSRWRARLRRRFSPGQFFSHARRGPHLLCQKECDGAAHPRGLCSSQNKAPLRLLSIPYPVVGCQSFFGTFFVLGQLSGAKGRGAAFLPSFFALQKPWDGAQSARRGGRRGRSVLPKACLGPAKMDAADIFQLFPQKEGKNRPIFLLPEGLQFCPFCIIIVNKHNTDKRGALFPKKRMDRPRTGHSIVCERPKKRRGSFRRRHGAAEGGRTARQGPTGTQQRWQDPLRRTAWRCAEVL